MASRGRGSKAKGSKAELEVARALSTCYAPERAGLYSTIKAELLPFRRTPGSGAWTRSRELGVGDIMPPEGSNYPFVIEVKCQEAWGFDQVMKSRAARKLSPVCAYWKQAVEQASGVKKLPMLVFTKNGHPFYVRIDGEKSKGALIETLCRGVSVTPLFVMYGASTQRYYLLTSIVNAALSTVGVTKRG